MTPDGFAPFVPRIVVVRRQAEAIPPSTASAAGSEEEVLPAPAQPDPKPPVEVRDEEARCRGEERTVESVRELAIKIAGEACARALREAIAKNPLFVARFVDDAMEAAGRGSGNTVRLSPVDAVSCRGRLAMSVVADSGVAPGEVVVETPHGIVTASIDQRAYLLVRAVADS